jgi:hypothetical protein
MEISYLGENKTKLKTAYRNKLLGGNYKNKLKTACEYIISYAILRSFSIPLNVNVILEAQTSFSQTPL